MSVGDLVGCGMLQAVNASLQGLWQSSHIHPRWSSQGIADGSMETNEGVSPVRLQPQHQSVAISRSGCGRCVALCRTGFEIRSPAFPLGATCIA
eukprot:3897262-Amphidinium_carterae.1